MCGVVGVAHADPRRPVDPAVLAAMNATLEHRGPDSAGCHLDGSVGLGIRRLAVIDLVTGDQPIGNETGDIHVVCNGEIYNATQLRRGLQARGHVFRTRSDVEPIVHLYEEQGVDCLRSLRGMFALALWDARERVLLLARDRVGKKPLFWTRADGALVFGSEIKALLRYPAAPRPLDLEALHHYLTLQYVPDPLTAFAGIHKLPPAHRLVWRDGEETVERYWDLPHEPKWDEPPAELRRRLRETVTEAVRIRLVSDVPLGAHLSGGIDSSIVVGTMARLMDRPVTTFSVGFDEERYSELAHARRVAERFGTDHHEIVLDAGAVGVLPELVRHFDEPFADSSAVPTWHLSRLTRRHVTVALNGDGGDEAFGGYQRYWADALADAYRLVPAAVRERVLDPALRALPARAHVPMERNVTGALQRLAQAARHGRGESIVRWGSYFDEPGKRALLAPEVLEALDGVGPSGALLAAIYERAPARGRLDRTLYTDVRTYLPGDLLPKVDRMSMAHGLEARSPLLDQEVLALAARLPASWKVRGRRTKRVLREVFADLLPPDIRRRGKQGFGVPLGVWLEAPAGRELLGALRAPDARSRALLRTAAVERLVAENASGRVDHGKRLWTLLVLEIWLREYGPWLSLG